MRKIIVRVAMAAAVIALGVALIAGDLVSAGLLALMIVFNAPEFFDR